MANKGFCEWPKMLISHMSDIEKRIGILSDHLQATDIREPSKEPPSEVPLVILHLRKHKFSWGLQLANEIILLG